MGANFYEYIGILRYQPIGKLFLTGKAIYTKYSVDTDSSNYGSNVLYSYNARPYYSPNQRAEGHFIANDNPTNLIHLDLTASWQLRHNMFIDVKQIIRRRTSSVAAYNNNSAISTVAFRWNIPQRLYEF